MGKLFCHLAAADGKVQDAEKEVLHTLIKTRWKPLENSADEFGADMANLIEFSFDYEGAEIETENGFESFTAFYKHYKDQFKPSVTKRILDTADEISAACRGKNKEEKEVVNNLRTLFINN